MIRFVRGTLAIALATVTCIAVGSGAAAQLQGLFTAPPDADGQRRAIDFNPAANVVEVVIAAYEWPAQLRTGQTTMCKTFNGIVPAPRIEANVGDKLIVHFFNFLPEPSSIHWHGIEVPATEDGSHISQLGVPAHGGYRRYEFDVLRAHTAWYHPHFNTMVQLEQGMYGTVVFRDPAEDQRLGLPASEATFVLDDVLLFLDGTHATIWPTDPAKNAERQLNGREGNVLLVNGSDARRIDVQEGVPVRWRVVNASSARFMRLSIPGHDLYRIGGDAGLIAAPDKRPPIDLIPWWQWPVQRVSNPDTTKGIMLSPGERAEFVWTPLAKAGTSIALEWHDIARGLHTVAKQGKMLVLTHSHNEGTRPPETLVAIDVKPGTTPPVTWVPPATLRPVTPINVQNAPTIDVMFGHSLPAQDGNVTFFAQMKNMAPLPFPKVTPADAPTVKPNDVRIIRVTNMTGGDHPFHIHGFFFQPIDVQYIDTLTPANNRTVPWGPTENKDVVIVPRRPGLVRGASRTVMRLAIRFDDTGRQGKIYASNKVPTATTSGGWLFHCHNLEHASRGMMSFVQVVP